MCVCEVEEGTNMYGGLDGWDERWICLEYVLGEVLCVMCVFVVWGGDWGFVIILEFECYSRGRVLYIVGAVGVLVWWSGVVVVVCLVWI